MNMLCQICGGQLVQTSERYLACPKGHGKLVPTDSKDRKKIEAEKAAFERRCDAAAEAVRRLTERSDHAPADRID